MEFLNPGNKNPAKNQKSSTQKYLDVDEIREGVMIMKSGALRAVLLVSSVNFDLKSSEEQEAIVAQYQNFLNSLDFPVQIVISSRRFNVEPYLDILEEKEKQQENELLRLQISEYREFIKNLTEVSNIMSKYFYIVVPFSPVEDEESGLIDKMFGMFKTREAGNTRGELFETYKSQLLQRVDHIIAALSGAGLRVTPLQTEELIELMYNSYNPSLYTAAVLKNIEQVELQ
jgi:type IV secretory pathway VirB4 component